MRSLLAVCCALTVVVGCGKGSISSPQSPPGDGNTGNDTNPTLPPAPPYGQLDLVDGNGLAAGWAYSPAVGSGPIDVQLVVDATQTFTTTANLPRADVNQTRHIEGDHGFAFQLPTALRDGKPHTLSAFARGSDSNVELSGSPMPFTWLLGCINNGPELEPVAGEYTVNFTASNGKFVTAECGGDDTGIVTANRDAAGPWEKFYVKVGQDGTWNLRSVDGRFVSAELGGGDALHANRPGAGIWEQFTPSGELKDGATVSLKTYDGAHYVSARVDQSLIPLDARATSAGANETFTVHVLKTPFNKRPGLVRADGRSWVDDQGPFYPLGGTLMWSLWGWKNDRDRLKQNLQFLARHGWDYVRILGEVNWTNETIDPNWPDYQQILGEFIDYAYDELGLRVEITLMGGTVDPMITAQKVVPVINANRQHKIMDLEVANESYGRPVTLQHMQDVGRYLRQNTQNLVSLSSAEGWQTYEPTATDYRAAFLDAYMQPGTANIGTVHMDRTYGDLGWRECRQPWDWKDFNFPISHNEPIGPRSSVAEEVDPIRLAMLRGVGLINGVEAFVLHNGAGVFGQVDPTHNRPANLWEVPNIDAIMDAVRGVDRWFPARVGDGQHWNNGWAGSPWTADAFWGGGDNHGVNRNYQVSTSDGWVATEAGVKDYVNLTATRHSVVEVYDVLLGKQQEVELQAGQVLKLTPVSKDSNGYGAFIIVGHYR